VVRSVGKEVDRPLERDGAYRTEPTPHPDPQARGIRRQADYEEKKLEVHMLQYATTVSICQDPLVPHVDPSDWVLALMES